MQHMLPPSGPDHLSAYSSGGAGQRAGSGAGVGPGGPGGPGGNMSIPSYREDGGGAMGGLSEAELGPLPQNWEKAYTERGEVYFIE